MTPVDRRRQCEVCGAQAGDHVQVAELDVRLCREHADAVARRIGETITLLRVQSGDRHVLNGRRLRDGEALEAIRDWARAAGYPVSSGGSVSDRIIAAYRAACAAGPQDAPYAGVV